MGIELICAYSPQAKGRVERANKTLQDRLVKELRLAGINNYQAANGIITVLLNGDQLDFKRFVRQPKRNPVSSGKALQWKPTSDHPWRQYGNRLNGKPVHAPN